MPNQIGCQSVDARFIKKRNKLGIRLSPAKVVVETVYKERSLQSLVLNKSNYSKQLDKLIRSNMITEVRI